MFQWLADLFSSDEFDNDAYDVATLDMLYPELDGVNEATAENEPAFRAAVTKWREYAAGLTDGRWRRSFNGWIDYYERVLNEETAAYRLVRTNPPR